MPADPRRFVVIGGGLAGLASAVWLAEAGKDVTLLERRGQLGGRTHAMRAETVDDVPDNGQHVIASGYEHLFRYLTSVGTRQFVAFPKSSTLRWPDGRKVTMQTTGFGAVRTLFGVHPDAGVADRLRAARATLRLGWQALHQPADLADLTTEQWFERVGMPAHAREALWDWLALGIAAEPVSRESAKVFANVLATGFRMGVKHRVPVTIGYPTVDLDTLYVTGALALFERARGGRALPGRRAAHRQIDDGAVTGVLLADGTVVPADAVVCAVPNSNVGGLLDDLPEHAEIYAAADKLGYTPIVSTNLYLDRALGTESAFEGLIGGTGVIDEVFDRQIMHGRSTEHGVAVLPDHQRRVRADPQDQRRHRRRTDGATASLLSRREGRGSRRGAGGQDAEGDLLPGGRHGFASSAATHVGAVGGARGRLDGHRLVGHHGERRAERRRWPSICCSNDRRDDDRATDAPHVPGGPAHLDAGRRT